MGIATNSDLSRAYQELTIFRLWEIAGLHGAVPSRDGIVKSPFREERTGSFSILGGGRGFKDHGANVSGGLKDFAKLCWPNLPEQELNDRIIEASGIIRTPAPVAQGAVVPFDPSAPPASGPTVVVAAVDPRVLKAVKSIERNARLRKAEDETYQRHEDLLKPRMDEKKVYVPEWPAMVAERYQEGVTMLAGDQARMTKLAKDRGWPLPWVVELLAQELLSYPLERWSDAGDRYAKRHKAFRVDFPIAVTGDGSAYAKLQPVGYHQRFYTPPGGGREEKKGWLYVPSFPKTAARSQYEHAIVKCGVEERGLKFDPERQKPESFIPPLPFVIGDLVNTRTIVLLEGQWDAITFYGACGWFHDTSPPEDVAVFGIRGAQGMDAFLGYWGRWLRANTPLAWVIADNDKAGATWREAPAAAPGELQPPGLGERLKAAGCRDVLISWLRPDPSWGKDFNDYYRVAQPDPTKMYRWMQRVGVLDANGGWA